MQEQLTLKPTSKISETLASNYHAKVKSYAGLVRIGADNCWTLWFENKEEADLERRCIEKRLSFELIETVEDEGYYPERAQIMEEKYQASGRTDGLYTGLC
jgi:hypothetical protein